MAANDIRNYGDMALLLECESTDTVLATADALRRASLPGVLDIVPGARTVLVHFADNNSQISCRPLVTALHTEPRSERTEPSRVDVVIEVDYGGVDLSYVAEHTGLSIPQVIEAHIGTPWRVGFGGFAPGFAYLVGGDHRLRVPRRAEPRTRVPAGSVALAGEFSGVYPRESPGGWQLIGHTDARLWDINRPNPAMLIPGMWVQFRAR
jgi:KipI family sensor histidine kinase inhibitor